MRPRKTGIRSILARFGPIELGLKLRISKVSLRERSLDQIQPMLTYWRMTSARMSGLQSALSTGIRAAGALIRSTSPLTLCLAGMTVDLAFTDRVADPLLLPMCGSVGGLFSVAGASASGAQTLLGFHPGALAVALMSVYIACRATSRGACWARLTTSILMIAAMWAGMVAGCLLAMRLASFLRMPSATMLSWAMMTLGMFIAHGAMSLCLPPLRSTLR